MGLKPITSYSPLRKGIVFGLLIFIFVVIKETYLAKEFIWPIFLSALTGGIVGGVVYGLISWFRVRNSSN